MVIRLKRCPKCQHNVERDLDACPVCGARFAWRASRFEHDEPEDHSLLPPRAPSVAPAPHDVTVALSASLLAPGTGQMYNHQMGKGLVMLAATVLTLGLALVWSVPMILLTLLVWTASIVDAGLIAGRVLNQERVGPWQWF